MYHSKIYDKIEVVVLYGSVLVKPESSLGDFKLIIQNVIELTFSFEFLIAFWLNFFLLKIKQIKSFDKVLMLVVCL